MTSIKTEGRRNTWRIVIAVAISVLFLVLALWDIEPGAVLQEVRGAELLPILGAVIIATGTFGIRLIRWRILLRGEGDRHLPWIPLWHAVAIGFMSNNVLPLRAGELIRSYTAARLTRTRVTAALSSVAVERLFDGVAVVALLAMGLFLSGLPTGSEVGGVRLSSIAVSMGLLFSGALLVAALVVAFPRVTERLVRRVIPSSRL
ncbi:MAG: lysylphosphatidylglycerol synthase transmembrane domain-containing protein, partial [Gemmatimonadales bacterium]